MPVIVRELITHTLYEAQKNFYSHKIHEAYKNKKLQIT